YSNHLLVVGLTPVDESKTNPKSNPITGGSSYFSNDRIKVFEETMRGTCEAEGVPFIPMFSQVPSDWQQNYLYSDGIHPNDAGHRWVYEQIWPQLKNMVDGAND
ncbi:MAG TPA: GDSL-type esterase/lipase family protein, partial [Candidatus Saccharimonadales bacterium]